jgi:electron transfer flavoprotein alpha subunit
MGAICVVIEHRSGEVRDISFEMLYKAGDLCRELGHTLTAVVLGGKDETLGDALTRRAERVIAFQDDRLRNFDSGVYGEVLRHLIQEERPFMTLMGHTAWGMDLAPALSVKTGYPLISDCVDIVMADGRPKGIRQIFGGKVYARVSPQESDGYLMSVRPGSFLPPEKTEDLKGELIIQSLPEGLQESGRRFVEFVDTSAGDVDISQADILVSIGRGIGDEENIGQVKEMADLMGGTLSCSRPVVDKNWLPKYHQVGTSGKTVKPKVYLALGISGAFQHVAGISGAGTVIAVNKDRKAPIFRVAHYGVVDDLFRVVEALKEKLKK